VKRQDDSVATAAPADERFDLRVSWPLLLVHAGVVSVFFTSWSPVALAVGGALVVARAFGLTAGYHRYFAHRSFRTSRVFQFALAWLGTSAAQLGPLWWAHMGWLLCRRYSEADLGAIQDFARFPKLRFLDRCPWLPPLTLALALYSLGWRSASSWASRSGQPIGGYAGPRWAAC
jgi:stearoyl-CoA desaturase (delta-9 desaturase)